MIKYRHLIIAAALGVCIGILLAWNFKPPPPQGEPVVQTVTVTKTVYKAPPQTVCEKSELWLKAEARSGIVHIDYGDACKSATATVKIGCQCPTDWKGRGVAAGAGFIAGVLVLILL